MPDFSDVVTSPEVQTALESLQRACMGPDGDFVGVDELVITQSIFAGFSHRYSDVRTGDSWTFITDQRIPRSELAWLKDLKANAFRPGVGSWITVQVHVFPVAPGLVEVFDQEILAAGGVSPPLYNPELKTVDWGNKRLPVTDSGTDLSADPVIIDPSQEPGFFSKIGQKLFGS